MGFTLTDKTTLGFIGLGVMGFPMAGHLSRSGRKVAVFNRSAGKAEKWREQYEGEVSTSPAELAASSDVIFLCVGADDDVRDMTQGSTGVFAHARSGSVIIDHTTTSATLARELDDAARAVGLHFIDAPVSGGQAGAENGALTVMAGGDREVFQAVQPLLGAYARMSSLLGPAGSGQLTKMVNQICIAGLVQGLAEGIHFAKSANLDVGAVIDVISRGAAQSWQMENRWQTMNEGHYEHGFAVDWMRKDLKYVLDEARSNHSRLPVTALVDQFYAEVQARGGNRWDTSSLLTRLNNEESN